MKIDFTFHYGPLWQPVRLHHPTRITNYQLPTSFGNCPDIHVELLHRWFLFDAVCGCGFFVTFLGLDFEACGVGLGLELGFP